ncbi:MAG TPA: hypothetical protein VNN20_15695 [Thermodesulfobacteriota bacterium]|nr:hypothetical protein [Thermodesulfobacteriota bacterium]
MKKYLIFIAVVAVILTYLFYPSGDDTREVAALLDQALESGKKKDLDGVMMHFSLNYRDEYGASYPVVKNIVKTYFDKFDSFDGKYSRLKASINETEGGEKQGVANLDIQVWGMKSGIPTPILGDLDSSSNITVTLKKSRLSGWKIVKVEGLEEAGGEF